MEVREPSAKYMGPHGYRHTEVGLVPEDWSVDRLGSLYAFQNGVNADKAAYGHGVPFVNVLEVITHGVIDESQIPGRVDLPAMVVATFAVKAGDVLFNRTSETQEEVGLASIYTGTDVAVFGGFVIRGTPRSDRLIPRFASYALRAPSVRTQIIARGQGVVRANVGQADLAHVHIALPAHAEQSAIAATLGDAGALIESLERLLAKKRQIKQGAMQELLTGKRRLPGFVDTWAPKRLGDLLAVCHGKSQRDIEVSSGDYPILATGGQIGWASRPLYDKPSVLIGRKGTIDRPQYMDKPFWTVDTLFYSIVHAPNNAKFLFYRFCLVDWMQHNEASGVPSLNGRTIESLEIDCPAGDEQTAIATLLSDLDTELEALEAQLTKARDIKQGMMQALLTGRIRLV